MVADLALLDTSAYPYRFQIKAQFIAPKPLKARASGFAGLVRRLPGKFCGFRGSSAGRKIVQLRLRPSGQSFGRGDDGSNFRMGHFARLPGLLPNASRGARILEAGSLTTLVGIAAAVARSLEKVLGGAFRHIALSQPSKCHL